MKNKKAGFIIPLLITIIALLAIGGGVYFYVSKDSNSKNIKQLSETKNEVVTPTSTQDQIKNNKVEDKKTVQNYDYTGFYVFAETGIQDPSVSVVYTLDIFKENDAYFAYINIDGFQTLTRIKAKILQKDSMLSVVFDSYLPNNMYSIYKNGDVLFNLDTTNTDKMKISWNIMKPSFDYTDLNNSFFEKSKVTQQDLKQIQKNIIGKWGSVGKYSISFMSDGNYQEEGTDSKSSIPSYGTWKILQNLRGENTTSYVEASMPNGIYLKITPQNEIPMYYVVNTADGAKLKYTYLSGLAGAAVMEFNRIK